MLCVCNSLSRISQSGEMRAFISIYVYIKRRVNYLGTIFETFFCEFVVIVHNIGYSYMHQRAYALNRAENESVYMRVARVIVLYRACTTYIRI